MVLGVVVAACAGCAFDASGARAADDADAGGAIDVDADVAAPVDAAVDGFCDDADPDLVACWRFEVAGGAVEPHDESMYRNDGAASGVSFVAGRGGAGTALQMAPAASALVPDSASLDLIGNFTIELWVHADALPPDGGRAGLIDNNGAYGLFLAPDGAVRCAMGPVTVIDLKVPVGVWTHVACVFDGATLELWQDGQPGLAIVTSTPPNTGGVDGVALGMNSPSGDQLEGAIDDVRVWKRVRTAKEICEAAETCD